jgi:hypothetical protein
VRKRLKNRDLYRNTKETNTIGSRPSALTPGTAIDLLLLRRWAGLHSLHIGGLGMSCNILVGDEAACNRALIDLRVFHLLSKAVACLSRLTAASAIILTLMRNRSSIIARVLTTKFTDIHRILTNFTTYSLKYGTSGVGLHCYDIYSGIEDRLITSSGTDLVLWVCL